MAFENPSVTRGRISIPAKGLSRTLMFNPSTVSDSKAINWGSLNVPGASHPVYQFGSGGERLISFEVYLDGDRGRFGRDGPARDTLSVQEDINFFQSLLYPGEPRSTEFAKVYPHIVLFTMGTLFDGVSCIVKAAPYTVNHWTPKMEPVRAVIQLQLAEIVSFSKSYSDILVEGALGSVGEF